MLDDQTKINKLSLSEFKVISMVVSIRTLSIQTMAKTLKENGENLILTAVMPTARDEFMFPPTTVLWKGIADGRTLMPELSLASMMAYFVTRKVCDGQNAGDFKHVNIHSYPLFKSGHIQKIMTIKGNDNNVYLNAVCLPEMRID